MKDNVRVALILRRFPQLSETFVGDEILMLRQMGLDISIYSMLRPKKSIVSQRFKSLEKDTVYQPRIWSVAYWSAQFYFLSRNPKTYLKRLIESVFGHWRNPLEALKVLWVFPTTVFFAKVCLDRGGVDHVHTHWLGFQADSAQTIGGLLGIPWSIRLHTRSQIKLAKEFPDYLHHASFVSVESYQIRDALLNELPILAPDKIVMVREQLPFLLARKDAPMENRIDPAQLRGFNLDNVGPLCLSVGRLVEKKGHRFLVQACAELERRGYKFRCLIVGDGPLRSSLEEEIAKLGVQNVTLLGCLSNEVVLELINKADVFVAPSVDNSDDVEGIPTAILEAMLVGRAIITTDAGAILEVIKDEETGLVVPQRMSIALANAINRLMESTELRCEIGQRAQKFICAEFSPERSTILLARWLRG